MREKAWPFLSNNKGTAFDCFNILLGMMIFDILFRIIIMLEVILINERMWEEFS